MTKMQTPSPSELLRKRSQLDDESSVGIGHAQSDGNSGAAHPRRPLRRKPRRAGLVVSLVIAALVTASILAVVFGSSAGKDGIPVETVAVSRRTITQTVTATGIIDPETQVKISSEVSGEIVYIGVEEGEVVRKGELLVRINPESMTAQVDEARAGVLGARAREAQAQASLLRSKQDLDRMQQLYERKLSTQQELDAATASVKIATAELEGAGYSTRQAEASLRRIRESLARTSIYAPISGVVTKLNSKVGEKAVGAIQMTGTEIMTIADLSTIEAVVDVSETDVVGISLGDTAQVEVDAMPDRKFTAHVSRIANSPKQIGAGSQDQVTNFEVRIRFLDPDARLRPGMSATATICVARQASVISVPIQSVTTRDTSTTRADADDDIARNRVLESASALRVERPKPVVFVRLGDTVTMIGVGTGIRDNEYIQITSGLRGGERVVSGSYKAITKDLESGSRVIDMPKVESENRKGRQGE